jgi:hypothetical protein
VDTGPEDLTRSMSPKDHACWGEFKPRKAERSIGV